MNDESGCRGLFIAVRRGQVLCAVGFTLKNKIT